MIWRHSLAPHVDLPWAKDADQPSNKVLHHALKHLMEDIRCNGKEYVGKQKGFSEWMIDGFQPSFTTSLVRCGNIAIGQKICVKHSILDKTQECLVFAKLIGFNVAFGAPAAVCTSHKCLLRVVADKNCKNGVASVPDTITAHHRNPCFIIGADQTQDSMHTRMK